MIHFDSNVKLLAFRVCLEQKKKNRIESNEIKKRKNPTISCGLAGWLVGWLLT